MSEHLPINPERLEHNESLHTPERKPHNGTEQESVWSEHDHQEHIKTIQEKVEQQAKSAKEIVVDDSKETEHKHPLLVSSGLKAETFRRTLSRIRKHLSVGDKSLSKAIHQPVVDAVSKVGEKTVARPKGILTGAIVALVGSSWVLYSAKHYGYSYNYLIVLILFAGGYLVGLVLELIWFALHRRDAK